MNRQFVVGLGRLGISMVPHRDTVLHNGDVLVVGGTKRALDSSPLVQPDGR